MVTNAALQLPCAALAMGLGLLTAGPSFAATITTVASDTFNVGADGSTKGTFGDDADDAADVPWFRNTSHAGALSIEGDTVLGESGNYSLRFRPYLGNPRSTVGPLYAASGDVPSSVTVGANIGDQVILSFDFRRPESNANVFSFGLYNHGTTQSLDHNTIDTNRHKHATNDSFGYFATIGVGGNGVASLSKETGGPLNNINYGGITGGSDILVLTEDDPIVAAINTLYSATFSLTRAADGLIVAFSIFDENDQLVGGASYLDQGGQEIFGSTPQSIYDTIDEIVFSTGGSSDSLRVDNVQLQTVVIPEPATAGLLVLGGLCMIGGGRRRNRAA